MLLLLLPILLLLLLLFAFKTEYEALAVVLFVLLVLFVFFEGAEFKRPWLPPWSFHSTVSSNSVIVRSFVVSSCIAPESLLAPERNAELSLECKMRLVGVASGRGLGYGYECGHR